jgi:hypothetical protein
VKKRRRHRPEPSLELIALTVGVTTPEEMLLDAVTRAHVRRVLDACEWNRSLAARALGIYRRTLQRMLDGFDRAPVRQTVERKSLSRSRTRIERLAAMAKRTDTRTIKRIFRDRVFDR